MYRITAVMLLISIAGLRLLPAQAFSEKKRLYDLLEIRKKKFDLYLASLNRKSGIFGTKTKNDLRESIDVLKDIVNTDNQIIAVMNRAVDFKVFEKSRMNYDMLERDEQLALAREVSAVMEKQLLELQGRLASKQRTVRLLLTLLAAMAAGFIIYYFKHRNA